MKESYKRLAVKLLIFTGLLVVVDATIGFVLRKAYFSQTSGLQYRTTYSMEQTTADVLFFGSSRCNHHYNPRIFEDSLQLSAYNVGRDGNGLPYHYAVLKSILRRYTPKVVVLDLLKGDFDAGGNAYERLSSLLPYYRAHPEIRDIIDRRSEFEKIKLVSSIYPFNSSLLTVAIGNMGFNKKRTEDVQGYLPLTKVWKGAVVKENTLSAGLDQRKVAIFESFIDECQKRKIAIYVLVSPYFVSFEQDQTLAMARQIAKRRGVTFWDFSKDRHYLTSARYFADPTHLNVTGSQQYSATIAQQLRRNNPVVLSAGKGVQTNQVASR